MSSGPALDASGVLAWRLLQFLDNHRPSVQEKRGDSRLDHARELARENEELISSTDLEIVKERITFANEIKMGLDSKKGLPRYLQAREYRKASKDTLKFVKTISDRARDATLGHNLAFPGHDTVQRPRGLVPHAGAVSLPTTAQSPIPIDTEASGEARFYYSPDPLTTDLYVHSDPQTTNVHRQLGSEMKPNVATLVETLYNFKTGQAHNSISYNAKRAQVLLKHMNFIYPEPRTGRRDPYRHPIIQRAINITWFRDRDDIGVVNHDKFSPIPVSIIALTLMVIEYCVEEWSSGTRKDSSWDDAKLQTVYQSHVASLFDFQAHSPASNQDLLYQLQCDLLQNAREHAGVAPDPITGLSRFPPGALDAVHEEDDQPSPTAPPDYDFIPRVTVNSA